MKKLVLLLFFIAAFWYGYNLMSDKPVTPETVKVSPKEITDQIQKFENESKGLLMSFDTLVTGLSLILQGEADSGSMDKEQTLVLMNRYQKKIGQLNAPGELTEVKSDYANSLGAYIDALELVKSLAESGRAMDLIKLKDKLDKAREYKAKGDQALEQLKAKYGVQGQK